MKKRFLVLLLTLVSVFVLTSCSKKYTVEFNTDGAGSIAAQEVKKGDTATEPEAPTKEGYDFQGWFNGNAKYNFSSEVTEDLTLSAKWKVKKFTVTYVADGASIPAQSVEYGNKAQNIVPSRAGFVFGGWYADSAFTSAYDFNAEVKANVTLYAKWEAEQGVVVKTVTLDVNGGTLTTTTTLTFAEGSKLTGLPTPKKDGFTFEGWFNGEEKVDAETVVTEDMTLVAKWKEGVITPQQYKPNWTPNQRTGNFDGQGMTVKILVKPVSSYDPFDGAYSGTNTKIKQRQQRNVESAYNVKIVYEEWASNWGPDRISDIKASIGSSWEYDTTKDENGVDKGGVYIISIASSWIPTLVKTSCLAELYNTQTETGIFAEVGYEETSEDVWEPGTYQQHETINQATGVQGKVYGYSQGNPHPDHFLYYNAQIISDAQMEDPAELWFKGEWTWDTFSQYCKALQNVLASDQKVLAVGYPEFFIGGNAAYGNPIATSEPALNLCSNTTYELLNNIKALYNSGVYDTARGVEDVPASFLDSKTVFVSGSLWFLNDATRFDPAKCKFTIGAVPYPAASGNGGTPITTTDEEHEDIIFGYDGEPLELNDGEYIIGLDLSESSLQIPYTSTECYSVVNFSNGYRGITQKVVFGIIYDLNSGLGKDPDEFQISTEEAYRNILMKKFNNNELYVDTLMSVDDRTYFELIEILSMTVGNGSHYQENGLWTSNGISTIIKKADVTPADQLGKINDDYKNAMTSMGYMV